MTDFYKRILEPILSFESDDLRKAAIILETTYPGNDDTVACDARYASAEVLNRVARLKDFADWIFSDELGEELDDVCREGLDAR